MKKKLLFTLTAMLAVFGLAFAETPEFNASKWWGNGDGSNGEIIQQLDKGATITKENITVATFQANKATVDAFKLLDDDDIYALITYFNTLTPEPYTAPTALKKAVAALDSTNNAAANEKVQSIIDGIEALSTDPATLTTANVKSLENDLNDWLTVKENLPNTDLMDKEENLTAAIATAKTQIAQNESKAVIADILRALLSNTSDNSANLKNLFPTDYTELGTEYTGDMTLNAFKSYTYKYDIVKLYIKEYDLIKDLEEGKVLEVALSTFADGLAEGYYNAALVLQKAEQYIIGTDAEESFVKKYASGTVKATTISGASEAQAKIYTYELNKILTQIGTPEAEYEDIAEMVTGVLTPAGVTNELYNYAKTRYKNLNTNTWILKLRNQFLSNHSTILTNPGQALQTLTYTLENTDELYEEITGAIEEIEKYYYDDEGYKSSLTDDEDLVYDPCGEDGDPYQVTFTHAEFNALFIGQTLKNSNLSDALSALKGGLKEATKYYYAKILRDDWIKAYKAEGKVFAADDYTIANAAQFKDDDNNGRNDVTCLNTKNSSSLVFTPSLPTIAEVEVVALENWKWNTSSNAVDKSGDDFGGDVMTQAYTFIKENDWTTPASEDCPAFTPIARHYAIYWINKYCSADASSILSKVRAAEGAQLSSALITEIDEALKFYTGNNLGTYSAFNASAKLYYKELTDAMANASADVATISGTITLYQGTATKKVLESDPEKNAGQALCYTSKKTLADTIAQVPNTIAYIAEVLEGDLPLNVVCLNSDTQDSKGNYTDWRATEIKLKYQKSFWFPIAINKVDSISMDRTFTKTGAKNPFLVPFKVNVDDMDEHLTFTYLDMVEEIEQDDKVLISLNYKTKKSGETLGAYLPYMITNDEAGTYTIFAKNTSVGVTKNTLTKGQFIHIANGHKVDCSTTKTSYTMAGVTLAGAKFPASTDAKKYYTLKNGFWQKFDVESTLPYSGTITLEFTTGRNKEYIVLHRDIVDGESTSIDNISTEINAVEGIYTIDGQKVENMNQPGLYIVNGKKIMKK